MHRVSVLLLSVFSGCWCVDQRFPPGFLFGAATASYQVEGAWNTSDKSENSWDRLSHSHPEIILDHSNGDIACDSYHLWRRDIEMMEELGLNMFSISWTRVLPSGFPNYVSKTGAKYYSDLIDGLLEKGIEPVVTIHHFDMPQILLDLGGWTNPLIVDWFGDYARVVYSLYGDRIKYWLTINEPFPICDMGYSLQHGPYLNDTKVGQYLCNKYIVMAHAKAWRIYDEEFKPKYHGKVSYASVLQWYEPKTPDDVEVTNLAIEKWESRYTHPVYSKQGGWPPKIEKLLAEEAKREGYPQPRLIPFTPEEIEFVKGTYDYYAVNHYSTSLVRKALPGEEIGQWPFYGCEELGIIIEKHPDWPSTSVNWFSVYPEGMRHHLQWLKTTYGDIDILITENGYPSTDTGLNDQNRLEYMKRYLEQVLLAIADGVKVIGYNAWSLMDNFEWLGGYKIRFGMYAVNFSSPLRTRTPRESARYYASVIRTHVLHTTDLSYI